MEMTFSNPMLKLLWLWQQGLITIDEFECELNCAAVTNGDVDVAKALVADAKKGLCA